ncbi:ATP-binding cassette domain-containing protein, partial [bacterium]|nr:ATP-binding cassette domain-containing protein [bacterium]
MDFVIEIENLISQYGEKRVLDGITLKIPKGKVSVILGGSGCGKSTLLKNIIGLINPFSGKITMLGKIISELDENEKNELLKNV